MFNVTGREVKEIRQNKIRSNFLYSHCTKSNKHCSLNDLGRNKEKSMDNKVKLIV